jgi:hypothetical protein
MHKVVVSLARIQPLEPLIYKEQRDSRGVWCPRFCADNHVGVGSSDESTNIRLDLGEVAIVRHPQILSSSGGNVTDS